MARYLSGSNVGCRPEAANTFTEADNADDVHIPVTLVDSEIGLPEPRVGKADTAGDDIYGKLYNWDAGAQKLTVQTTGIVQFTMAAAVPADAFGKGVEGAGGGNVQVAGTARQGTGRIIARNGTNVWVDLDKAPNK